MRLVPGRAAVRRAADLGRHVEVLGPQVRRLGRVQLVEHVPHEREEVRDRLRGLRVDVDRRARLAAVRGDRDELGALHAHLAPAGKRRRAPAARPRLERDLVAGRRDPRGRHDLLGDAMQLGAGGDEVHGAHSADRSTPAAVKAPASVPSSRPSSSCAVEVAVLDPVQARAVHEPQPRADRRARRGRQRAPGRGDAREDPRGRGVAHAVDELAHPLLLHRACA